MSADTALSAFYTGQTFIKQSLVDSFSQQLYMFFLFIVSMFTGSSVLPESLLSQYTRKNYIHFYGGVFPYYGWYYLGPIGVVAFAFLIVLIIRKLYNKKNIKLEMFVPIIILISSSSFLWYLYHPSSLIRSPMLMLIVFYVVIWADKLLKKLKTNLSKKDNKKSSN